MPTFSSSAATSSVHLSKFSKRPKSISGSISTADQGKPKGSTGSDECLSWIMRPEQDPKKVPNGCVVKKEKVVIRYGECRKNHAANIGRYAVDGCREFMASGEEGTSASFNCAACNCHRNFHKREVESYGDCDCMSDSTSQR